jgi:hypothetical protein
VIAWRVKFQKRIGRSAAKAGHDAAASMRNVTMSLFMGLPRSFSAFSGQTYR